MSQAFLPIVTICLLLIFPIFFRNIRNLQKFISFCQALEGDVYSCARTVNKGSKRYVSREVMLLFCVTLLSIACLF